MKKIKYVISIMLVIFAITSCFRESNIDLEPITDTEADVFDQQLDFEKAMLGTYSKVMDLYIFGAPSGDPLHSFWLLPGDDLTSNGSFVHEVFNTIQPGDELINRYFRLTYQLLNRVNTNLEKIAIDEDLGESAFDNLQVRDYIKGENYFLRGLAFYNLWNYYGTAPVIMRRIISSEDIHSESSDGMQLLDQAISDFTEAAALLPQSWLENSRGRATKNSAYGYLGKALVFKANWTNDSNLFGQAVTAIDNVQDRSLVANYGDNFSAVAENNNESIFEVQAGHTSSPEDNVWLWNDDFSVVGSFSAYYGYFDGHWSLWSGTPYIATNKLVNAIDPDDPRLPYIVDPSTRRIQKYMLQNEYTQTGVSTINNPRLLRYADLLLLKAEAMNETGDQDGAIALINQIRTRARNMGSTGIPADHAAGASQSQVRQWIMDERFVEFAAEEGHRWLDLRRWHKAGHLDLESFDFDSDIGSFGISMPKHLLWPIPNGEIDLNPMVKQNDGY